MRMEGLRKNSEEFNLLMSEDKICDLSRFDPCEHTLMQFHKGYEDLALEIRKFLLK